MSVAVVLWDVKRRGGVYLVDARAGIGQRSLEASMYCRPDAVGRGCATALYTALFAALEREDVRTVDKIERVQEWDERRGVRSGFSPVASQLLHSCGFTRGSSRCKLLIPLARPALSEQSVRSSESKGEVSEGVKEHAWKACVGETLPWVRIPLSPNPPFVQNPWQFGGSSRESDALCHGCRTRQLSRITDEQCFGGVEFHFRGESIPRSLSCPRDPAAPCLSLRTDRHSSLDLRSCCSAWRSCPLFGTGISTLLRPTINAFS